MSTANQGVLDELFAKEDYRPWRVGLSLAASHAWGPSIAATLGILITIGFWPAVFWAIGNTFFMPIFIYLYRKFPELKFTYRLRGMLVVMLAIQFFAVWNNQQLIFEIAFGQMDVELYSLLAQTEAMLLAFAVGITAYLFIYRYGLPGSMTTDVGQYAFMLAGPLTVIGLSVFVYGNTPSTAHFAVAGWGQFPTNPIDFIFYNASGYWWGILGGVSYLGHGYVDAQQWSRVERSPTIRTGLWFSFWFGIYLTSVFVMASVLGLENIILASILLIAAIAVASATLDSSAAAMQRLIGHKRLALGLGLFAIVAWPLVYELGVIAIWGIYAIGRFLTFAAVMAVIVLFRLSGSNIRNYIGGPEYDPDREPGLFGVGGQAEKALTPAD